MGPEKESNELVTVIMPNYCCPYLYEAIDSVLLQDYDGIQLIITDDCSPQWDEDGVQTYLRIHGQKLRQWMVRSTTENNGTVRNITGALKYASGKYVFFLASDDLFYDKNVISDWVAEFQKSGADVITAKRECFDPEMRISKGILPLKYQIRWIQTLSSEALYEKLIAENFIFGCCTARTMECIERYRYCDESYFLIDDYPQNLYLLRNGVKINFFNRTVIRYRMNGASSPARYNAKYKQDAERIFKTEILPHTKHPFKARFFFRTWEKHQSLMRYYETLTKRFSGFRALFPFIKAFYFLIQPSYVVLRIMSFFRSRML